MRPGTRGVRGHGRGTGRWGNDGRSVGRVSRAGAAVALSLSRSFTQIRLHGRLQSSRLNLVCSVPSSVLGDESGVHRGVVGQRLRYGRVRFRASRAIPCDSEPAVFSSSETLGGVVAVPTRQPRLPRDPSPRVERQSPRASWTAPARGDSPARRTPRPSWRLAGVPGALFRGGGPGSESRTGTGR